MINNIYCSKRLFLSKKNLLLKFNPKENYPMPTLPSNKGLVLSTQEIDGYNYTDMGYLLAEVLKTEDLDSVSLPMKAFDAVKAILKEQTFISPEGTKYVAIKNFNILFEPSLKINVRRIVEESSKGIITILKLNQPIDHKKTYYPFPGDNNYSLDLSDFSVHIQTI